MASFRSQTVFVNLTGRALEVAFGAAPAVRYSFRQPNPSSAEEWRATLDEIQPILEGLVEDAGARGQRATVYYRSITLSSHFCSVPAPAKREAESAARLACVGSMTYPVGESVIDAAYIGRDASGESRKWHFISAVDRASETGALARMIEDAGLIPEQIIPLETAVLAHLANEVLHDAGPLIGRLYISEERTCFVVSEAGRIRLVRQIGFTLDQLTEAMTRPILLDSETNHTVEWDRQIAQRALLEIGVPEAQTIIDSKNGILGRHLMPLIQPTLQRLLVELKQTLRFGIDETSRLNMRIRLCGPGATVNRLSEVLSASLTIPVEIDIAYMEFDPSNVGGPGSDFGLARNEHSAQPELNLLPRSLINRQVVRRFRSALWMGVAAAVAFMAADTIRLQRALTQTETALTAARARYGETEDLATRRAWLISSRNSMLMLENRVAGHVDFAADWPAVLRELSRLTPESAQLLSVVGTGMEAPRPDASGRVNEPACRIRVEGLAHGVAGHEFVKNFVNDLRQSPLFSGVNLDDVRKDEIDGESVEQFSLTIEAHAMPVSLRTAQASPRGEESR